MIPLVWTGYSSIHYDYKTHTHFTAFPSYWVMSKQLCSWFLNGLEQVILPWSWHLCPIFFHLRQTDYLCKQFDLLVLLCPILVSFLMQSNIRCKWTKTGCNTRVGLSASRVHCFTLPLNLNALHFCDYLRFGFWMLLGLLCAENVRDETLLFGITESSRFPKTVHTCGAETKGDCLPLSVCQHYDDSPTISFPLLVRATSPRFQHPHELHHRLLRFTENMNIGKPQLL